ncbi:hypothetical protein GCM10011383_34480 [Hymenobacter cavernae]|uniref:CsbD-like domain-containing protein n=2 Tax=Hymenobacter cavernae TaxID=2044852 RepID=A0ABQ1UL38_9BACT|nr:hypothetical protein GCM10011383_34480 [Hymenobacter cavernae]
MNLPPGFLSPPWLPADATSALIFHLFSLYIMSYQEEDNTGKILLAALAGAGAGIIAGLLIAPDNGKATRENLKNTATKYSGQLGEQLSKYGEALDTQFKGYVEKLEELGVTLPGSGLKLKGNWDELKGKLQEQYAQLTDEDLTYAEGKGDELIGRLQQKLGKGKSEIVKLLNDL